MQNEDGKVVDIYVPRKCSATNKLLHSKDHAAVQLNLGHVDQNGVYTGQYTTVALSGFVRKLGNSDDAVNRLAAKNGLIKDIYAMPGQHLFKGKKQ